MRFPTSLRAADEGRPGRVGVCVDQVLMRFGDWVRHFISIDCFLTHSEESILREDVPVSCLYVNRAVGDSGVNMGGEYGSCLDFLLSRITS